MRSKWRLVPVAVTFTAAGCSAGGILDGNVCTLEARASITVDVRDSASNAIVGRGSTIIARDGAVSDTADTRIDGPFALFFERAGTYTVSVTQTGYQPWSRTGVQVTKGSCHVNGVALTARLQK